MYTVLHKFFAVRVAKIWNNLPSDSIDFSSMRIFKSSLNTDILVKYCRVNFF